MQNLNSIPIVGKFTDAASAANNNFAAVKLAIDQLELTTSRAKGLFTSVSALSAKHPSPVVGDWAIVQDNEVSPPVAIVYKCSTSGTWSNTGMEWDGGSVDLSEYALIDDVPECGYYTCNTGASTAAKSVTASGYHLKVGGNVRILMANANTAANPTLNIGSTGAKPLYYDGEPASSTNSWVAGETVMVYYDGTRFMASNSQSSGGKAEKIKYDNSQSGLASNNVQGALNELSKSVVNSTDDAQASLDISDQEGHVIARFKGGNIQTLNFDSGKATVLGGANEEDSNLDVADEYGNVIARFENGHIRTKNFDSSINGSAVPEYWKTYLDNKKSELIAAELSIGSSGASFIFITDVHWKDNYKKSPAIISYIRQITQVKDVICGGDILEAHGARAAKIAEMLDWNECVKPVGCINIVGNHDYNTSDQPKSTWETNRIKPEEFYRMCNSETEKVVTYSYTNDVSVSEAGYSFNAGRYTEYFGYSDNNNQKIRYIYLDSTCVHKPVQDGMLGSDLRISDAQLRWMQDRITELEEGWTVLVFTHIALGANGLFEIGQQIENALDSIYDSAAATIAGVICGHCHKTLSFTTSKGYPFISTTCDARMQSQAANDPTGYSNGGDVNEQAFDIFYVNTNNRTIHVIRIGAGDTDLNRDFTY